MGNTYKLLDKTREHMGVTLRRIYWIDEDREGGWLGPAAHLPQNTEANVYSDAMLIGGDILGGDIWGGTIRGGNIWGGTIWGGTIRGGTIRGGNIWGGTIRGGDIWGGTILDGNIRGGNIRGGTFLDGEFYESPSCAQRSDGYMFIAKIVDCELRILAGCRNFSWQEALSHWDEIHPHGEESRRIIHFLKEQAEQEELRRAAQKGEAQ